MSKAKLVAIATVVVTALAAASAADAAVCRARVSGAGTGTGIFGSGTENARAAATVDWQSKAAKRFGSRFGSFAKASGVQWDCAQNALVQAKCVVTGRPCR